MKKFLNPSVAGTVALFSLGGCAYVTPYPAAFPTAEVSEACAAAVSNPGSASKVNDCLIQRGREWDNRGGAIRRQSGFVGQMSVPLGIAGLGLSAGGDRSDFVPISAGVTSASLAHTGAYARPTQAEVYELATVSYRCLISSVAEWNGTGRAVVDRAFLTFENSSNAALEAVRKALYLTRAERTELQGGLLTQQAIARHTNNTLDGNIGTALLRQSDEIDAAVIRAIRDRLPDPQAVAASIAARTGSGGDAPSVVPPASLADAAGDEAAIARSNLAKSLRGESQMDRPTPRQREAADIAEQVATATFDAAAFNAAKDAYVSTARTVSKTCAFNPSLLPVLTATPAGITLDSTGKGFFVVRNGVPPYGHLPLPAGVSLTPTPIGGNAMRFEVSVPPSDAAPGPWNIQVIDASPAGGMAEVSVTRGS